MDAATITGAPIRDRQIGNVDGYPTVDSEDAVSVGSPFAPHYNASVVRSLNVYALGQIGKCGVQLDGVRLPMADRCIDLVCSFETLEHVDHPEELVLECWRVLKPGGTFLCSTPNRTLTSPVRLRPANPYHRTELSVEEFGRVLSEHFSEVTLLGQDFYGTWRAFILRAKLMLLQLLGMHSFGRKVIRKAIRRNMNAGTTTSLSEGISQDDGTPISGEMWELRQLDPSSNRAIPRYLVGIAAKGEGIRKLALSRTQANWTAETANSSIAGITND